MSEPAVPDDPQRLRPWETTTDPGIGTSGPYPPPPPSPWSSTSVLPVVPPAPALRPPPTSWPDPFAAAWSPASAAMQSYPTPIAAPPSAQSHANQDYATQDYATQAQPAAPAHEGSLLDLDLEPGPEPPSRGAARSRAVPAAVGLVILALLAAGTVLAVSWLPGHHHSVTATRGTSSAARTAPGTSAAPSARPSGTASAKPPAAIPAAQVAATTIDTDVARSVAARRLLGPATTHIGACRADAADIAGLDRAARIRTDLVSGLAHLDVHTLAGGAAVVTQLRTAWTYSARADAAYAAWGRAHRNCSGHAPTTGDRNYARAQHNDTLATAAKVRAVKLWNRIAGRYHLPARAAGAI